MTEQVAPAAPDPSPGAPARPAPKHLVLLVHGINTHARWITVVSPVLNRAGLIAAPCGYDRYGIVRFLLPFDWPRRKAIERVRTLINAAIEVHKPERISVIAHSFGSYIVARLVAKEFQLKWHRIIFCGSVNEAHFPFEQLLTRFEAPIINDIGSRDALPAIAARVTWGYGSIGSHGALSAIFKERWHNGLGHSDFLNAKFCEEFWIPWLRDGVIVEGNPEPDPLPLWARILVWLPLRWMAVALLVAVTYFCVGLAYSVVRGPVSDYYTSYRSSEGPITDLNSTISEILGDMAANCSRGRFGRWRLGQACIATQTGSGLTFLKGCQSYNFMVKRPEDALRQAATQFQCLDVKESRDVISVTVRPGTTQELKNGDEIWWLCGCTPEQVQTLQAGP